MERRLILTDIGNIVTTFKYRGQLVKEIMAAFTANPINIREMFSVVDDIDSEVETYYHGLDIGAFDVQNLWARLVDHCKVSHRICTYPLFLSLWCKHLVPIVEVVELYRSLQAKYPLVAVSNGDSEGVRHILCHFIGSHGLQFHEIFISAERKEKKPGLLRQVADFVVANGIQLKDCVFIDDIQEYVAAAKRLDIPAIQFDGSKQPAVDLENTLRRLGFR